jgi:hypothetical protein
MAHSLLKDLAVKHSRTLDEVMKELAIRLSIPNGPFDVCYAAPHDDSLNKDGRLFKQFARVTEVTFKGDTTFPASVKISTLTFEHRPDNTSIIGLAIDVHEMEFKKFASFLVSERAVILTDEEFKAGLKNVWNILSGPLGM